MLLLSMPAKGQGLYQQELLPTDDDLNHRGKYGPTQMKERKGVEAEEMAQVQFGGSDNILIININYI